MNIIQTQVANQVPKKTLLISFYGVFQQWISLIRTGLLDTLSQKGYQLLIIVPQYSHKEHLVEYFHGKDVIVEVFDKLEETYFEKLIRILLYLKYMNRFSPKRALLDSRRKGNKTLRRIVKTISAGIVAFIPEKILLWFEYIVLSKKEIDSLYLKYKPALTILHWPGIVPLARLIVRSAKKHRCKTISVDACWVLMELSAWIPILDKLLVWNEFMKEEAIKYHGYLPEEIAVTGILRCDFYRKQELLLGKEDFFKRNSFDLNKRLVTFAPNSTCPVDIAIKAIKAMSKARNIAYPFQVYVRLDPSMNPESFREFLGDPLIRIGRSFNISELVSESDLIHLVNLLAYSDVVITLLSTLILESCHFNKPNISIAFKSLEYFYERDFIQPLFRQGGVRIVHDEKELIRAINDYLTNPDLDNYGRANILKNLCFGGDGRATQRTLSEIENLL